MESSHDVIVLGARCAGAPTAMLLARMGHRVLMVDRATFPSDTVSTHVIHPLGVAALARWGLRERLVATGCPQIHTYTFDFGPFTLAGSPGTAESPVAYCPRRTILDRLLVEAAADAGAEVREGFTVDDLLIRDGRVVGITGHSHGRDRDTVAALAPVVVGADGRNSLVAASVRAERYDERPPLLAAYYAYWSGLPMEGRFETYVRPRRGGAAAPTNDGLTMMVIGVPYAERASYKQDVEGTYLRVLETVPDVARRMRSAKRESRYFGAAVPNFFRKPYGPGWALVGDAGYNRDFITAQGISDAFRDAEGCARALHDAFTGARTFEDAMVAFQRSRDQQVRSMYEFTCQLATLEPPPPDLQRLFRAIAGRQGAMDAFARMNAGTISPAEFFSPANLSAMTASAAPQPGV